MSGDEVSPEVCEFSDSCYYTQPERVEYNKCKRCGIKGMFEDCRVRVALLYSAGKLDTMSK
jgi:hypothetical protein